MREPLLNEGVQKLPRPEGRPSGQKRYELELQIQCIFNKPDLSIIEDEGIYFLWLVVQYGRLGYNFTKCCELADGHRKIMKTVRTYNLGIQDCAIVDFVRKTIV